MTLDHTDIQILVLGMVQSELVGLPGKVFTRDSTRSLNFVVHASGWLHSMVGVLSGCSIVECCLFSLQPTK